MTRKVEYLMPNSYAQVSNSYRQSRWRQDQIPHQQDPHNTVNNMVFRLPLHLLPRAARGEYSWPAACGPDVPPEDVGWLWAEDKGLLARLGYSSQPRLGQRDPMGGLDWDFDAHLTLSP
jgi:hypothetical protein